MRKFGLLPLALLLTVAVGCQRPSLNVERSLLRGSGDVSATLVINIVDNQVEVQKEITTYAIAILKWLDKGEIDKQTAAQVAKDLKKIIPAKYWSLIDMAMGALDNVQADPTALLGVNNLKRLKAFFRGVQTGSIAFEVLIK